MIFTNYKNQLKVMCMAATLSSLCACDILQSCDQEFDPASGNLDRVADLLMVTPADESFLILANPEIEQLRVFNTRNSNFERAPNVYSPLSIRTGPSTRRLAKAPTDESRFYALDASDDTITSVRTSADAGGPAFSIVKQIDTPRAPSDLAVLIEGESPVFFVSTNDDEHLTLLDDEGVTIAEIDLPAGARPARMMLDKSGATLVVVDASLEQVHIIDTATRALDRSIDTGAVATGLSIGVVDVGDGLAPVALIEQMGGRVAFIRLYRPGYREPRSALLGRVGFENPVVGSYVPDNSDERVAANVCCFTVNDDDASTSWAQVVTSDGRLHYIRVDATRALVTSSERVFETADAFEIKPRFFNANVALSAVVLNDEESGPNLCAHGTDTDLLTPSNIFESLTGDVTFEGVVASRNISLDDNESVQLPNFLLDNMALNDEVVLTLSDDVGGSCESTYEGRVTEIDDGRFNMNGLDDIARNCIEQSTRTRATVRAVDSYVVRVDQKVRTRYAFDAIGDCEVEASETRVELSPLASLVNNPGVVLAFTNKADNDRPERDTQWTFTVVANGLPVVLPLAASPENFGQTGFGTNANLLSKSVGGVVRVDILDSDDTELVRRQYLAGSSNTGIIFEMAETETRFNGVVGHQ